MNNLGRSPTESVPVMSFTLALALLPALALGGALGFLGGLFGIGGGILAIPVLVLGYGLDQATAQGTALVMMVPNLAVAWWRYVRRNPVTVRGALAVAVVATLTTWAAARLAQGLDQQVLRVVFALFLAALGVGQLGRLAAPQDGSRGVEPAPPSRARSPRLVPLVGLLGGGSMGLLGVGGGLVATPVLTGWFRLGQRAAQSMALALVTPSSAMALAAYAQGGRVDWPVGCALAVGGVLTVSVGVTAAHACSERTLQRLFGTMLIATAAILIAKMVA